MDYVTLVNEKDEDIGKEEKKQAHLNKGKLHRAFSTFIFNEKGELLLQKRSSKKMLWPGFWSNSCCSHPKPKESVVDAGERRLKEELGFSCKLTYIGSFIYKEKYKDIGTEHEFCHILAGKYQGDIAPNPEEVEETRWVKWSDLMKEIDKDASLFTPWFLMEIEKFSPEIEEFVYKGKKRKNIYG